MNLKASNKQHFNEFHFIVNISNYRKVIKNSFATFLLFVLIQPISGQHELNMKSLSQIELPALGNDVWGYVDSIGNEYVIAGNRLNSQIFSLSNPADPQLISTIPGSRSVWRDFKSYKNYIYIVADQGDDGLTIVNMNEAPDTVSYKMWTDTVRLNNDNDIIRRCHNIYIDTIKGHAYLSGCNNGIGGIIILDLSSNPEEPTIIGVENQAYSHDVVTLKDRMYTSEIFDGALAIYDISDPAEPLFISKTFTSTFFTHNAWPSDDGKYIFTTDEKGNGYVDAYDISDESNIKFLDKYRPVDDANVLPHNTHFIDDFLVTSWYTEGVIILDAKRPHNLIRVAQYDTNPQDANGNWGVTPYLPSGLILATDMDNGLFVLEADYQRAAYLEGNVTDINTTEPINGALIEIISGTEQPSPTQPNGSYATGTAIAGTYEIIVSHPEYFSDTINLSLSNGEVVFQDFELQEKKQYKLNGQTINQAGEKISDVQILINGIKDNNIKSDENGLFSLNLFSGEKDILFGKWGFKGGIKSLVLDDNTELELMLEEGYEDDFFVDLGWTTENTAETGVWERAIPKPTSFNGNFSNPETDVSDDLGTHAYITGNNNSSVGIDDVDDGYTSLISPLIELDGIVNPQIQFNYWFYNNGGNSTPNDMLDIELFTVSDTILIESIRENSIWKPYEIIINDYTSQDSIRLAITVSDDIEAGHLVEGGFDAFRLSDIGTSTSTNETSKRTIGVYPNPTDYRVTIKELNQIKKAQLIDLKGNRYSTIVDGNEIFFNKLPSGMYILNVKDISGNVYNTRITVTQ